MFHTITAATTTTSAMAMAITDDNRRARNGNDAGKNQAEDMDTSGKSGREVSIPLPLLLPPVYVPQWETGSEANEDVGRIGNENDCKSERLPGYTVQDGGVGMNCRKGRGVAFFCS